MGTILPTTSQLTLSLEPGLSQRHLSMVACMAAGVYSIGLERIAGKCDQSPSKLSEKLSGGTGERERDVGLRLYETYLDKTGDYTTIYYLIDKYLSNPQARQQEALANLAELAQSLPALLAAAGLTQPGKRK